MGARGRAGAWLVRALAGPRVLALRGGRWCPPAATVYKLETVVCWPDACEAGGMFEDGVGDASVFAVIVADSAELVVQLEKVQLQVVVSNANPTVCHVTAHAPLRHI